ncbi:MAG: hypothetical protein JXL97_17890 [Bacteroidales bacterium]|nr:hypothetical protein [Bacteroidales bacterium]
MKKLAILTLLIAFLGLNFGFAAVNSTDNSKVQTVKTDVKKDGKFFTKIKNKIENKVDKVKETFSILKEKLQNQTQDIRTALILMVIGLIFLILAGAIGGSIVWAVGAIFFLIGAVLLLLEIL